MYTVGIDTSHLFLLIVLMDEDRVIDYRQLDCFKQQSEYIIVTLDELLKANGLTVEQVGSLVVTLGPGSYTGVRIGLTVAKVLGSIAGKQVYTLSTLQLYAGLADCYVLMDARAKRVYVGHYKNGQPLEADQIIYNADMEETVNDPSANCIGDLHLFGKPDRYEHLAENFMALKPYWQKVEDIDRLAPKYLKSRKEYLK